MARADFEQSEKAILFVLELGEFLHTQGHYERKLNTKAGEAQPKIPKLRGQTFETAIIERYRRLESSVEEALIERYLAGVSVCRVENHHRRIVRRANATPEE